jgi:CheY-like chemotaxis protein
MSSWEEALHELKREFVRDSLERVEKMRGLLRALGAQPGDAGLRHALSVHFHGLAGAGSSYGLPEVSRLGLAGERLLLEADAARPLDPGLLPSLGELIRDLALSLAPEQAASGPAAAGGPRILCVEGFEEQSAFLKTVLRAAGYTVEVVEDPRGVPKALEEFRPDLVLMDTLLTGASGFDPAQSLRRDPRFASLPVLLMTTDAPARARGPEAGGDEHLVKPIEPKELLRAVARRLEGSRANWEDRNG